LLGQRKAKLETQRKGVIGVKRKQKNYLSAYPPFLSSSLVSKVWLLFLAQLCC
jgi:hypothetical protein